MILLVLKTIYSSRYKYVIVCFALLLPQILDNYQNWDQFWTLLVQTISKHPLHVQFDQVSVEILSSSRSFQIQVKSRSGSGQVLVRFRSGHSHVQIKSTSKSRSNPDHCSSQKQTQNWSFRVKNGDLQKHYKQMSTPIATHRHPPLSFSKLKISSFQSYAQDQVQVRSPFRTYFINI